MTLVASPQAGRPFPPARSITAAASAPAPLAAPKWARPARAHPRRSCGLGAASIRAPIMQPPPAYRLFALAPGRSRRRPSGRREAAAVAAKTSANVNCRRRTRPSGEPLCWRRRVRAAKVHRRALVWFACSTLLPLVAPSPALRRRRLRSQLASRRSRPAGLQRQPECAQVTLGASRPPADGKMIF